MTRIKRLLVANRGEIASRIIRSARSLDIETVAVFSEFDSSAPYVRDADMSVTLVGNAPRDTYLNADSIIQAAIDTGCDAVHPGYGFLSERAEFATACSDAGLVFVGPPASAIAAMGSKIEAKRLMAAAGVPILAGITIEDSDEVVAEIEDLAETQVGFPILVKAAFGGGGRGMRIVTNRSELLEAIDGARREAASAFGNGTVFLERFVDSPRHIEVQIFGDTHGNVIHLFERECSIQRRYQKIIEEAPSSFVTETLRAELGAAAVSAAKAIGYVGAGTVEFVMDSKKNFFFLEVNTRLQVEHPTTEMITGLDLVKLQLLVAEGNPLPKEAINAQITGHSIEVRLYAEDVPAGFLPATGMVHCFDVPMLEGIRVDSGVETGSEVGVFYDPMLAKIISYGRDREEARRRLARALSETRLHGVKNNLNLLVAILRDDEFSSGSIDTGFLLRHTPVDLIAGRHDPTTTPTHALAVALAVASKNRSDARVLRSLPSGWRNVPNKPQRIELSHEGKNIGVSYHIDGTRIDATVDDAHLLNVILYDQTTDGVDISVNGVRRQIKLNQVGERFYVDEPDGSSVFDLVPRFPAPGSLEAHGSLIAPMPGTVVRIAVEAGNTVSAGTAIVVLEAMKMEHTIRSPHDGIVKELLVTVGQNVDLGYVLAVVEGEE